MKKMKVFLFALIACIMAFTVALTACGGSDSGSGSDDKIEYPDGPGGNNPPNRPGDGSFVNPGDSLGGGGTGEVADKADSSGSDSAKDAVAGKSDLSDLSKDTSSEGAVEQPAGDRVEISKSGTYYFKGEYGEIYIAKSSLKLHFIFDGAIITNKNGLCINGTDFKKTELVITLIEGTQNTVINDGDDVNAIHIKGSLAINGKGVLSVVSDSKSALKASKEIKIVDSTLNLTAVSHGITGTAVIASNCTIGIEAGKDGINAECDGATEFTTDEGYVALTNVNYTCSVSGDGIQADTVVYIDGGNYNIGTNGSFVQKTSENMTQYGLTSDDFKYIKSGSDYKRIASDEAGRYGSNLYALTQSCKGIKVGVIEYEDDDKNTVTVTGDYLIAIVGGTFTIDSADDNVHANGGSIYIEGGTYTLSTCDDAVTSDVLTRITDGDITIKTSYEGIEGAYVEISGGKIDLTASDDGINAASDDRSVNAHIIISGGEITVNSGGDGIDSNGSILISGGTVTVHGPTTGRDAGLDADKGIVITGGTVFVTSTLGMVETPSTNSTQYVISYAHQSMISAGSTITLTDSDGNSLVSVTVKKNCQSVIISCPEMQKGATYKIYGGDTLMTSFTVSSVITTVGSSGSSFPGGGFPGGPGGRPGGR